MNAVPELADRYARQSLFARIGADGQRRIGAGKVLVVGCGGLGATAINLLVRAGVGHVTMADRDVVEASNLPRQLLYEEADVLAHTPKATAAAAAARRINSEIELTPVDAEVTAANIVSLVTGMDVVIDATDNIETRYLINDACVQLGVPWVYGGVVGSTGIATTIVPGKTGCFQCLFPPSASPAPLPTSATHGVLGGAVVIVAANQWTQAIKILLGADVTDQGIYFFDVWTGEHQSSEPVPPVPDCPCCGQRRFEFLTQT